jgi:multiple sugar transport system substrate-binding protein
MKMFTSPSGQILRGYAILGVMVAAVIILALLVRSNIQSSPTSQVIEVTRVVEPAAEEPAIVEPAAEEPAVSELNILWAQWYPADYLQEIGNMYEAETGIKVNVIQEHWVSFGDLFFTEMAAQGDSWDLVVGDSQWLGRGATQGNYVDLTDFLVGEGIADTVTEATLTYYGEYPIGSGKYWAYPTEGDAEGWAYRKDLFEDPANMEAFEAEYGYPLVPPETYDQLMDIAQFFTWPDEGLYGVAIHTRAAGDVITMGVENFMFSWGASWQDENNNVLGVVNSPEAIEALQFYRDLYECCQAPSFRGASFDEVNNAFSIGQVAMAMNFFSFFPALLNPENNPYADSTGFIVNPAGPYGDQSAAMGGQGLSIVNYIPDERKEAAKDFIRWFAQDDVQTEWARLGGFTNNVHVLQSQEFLDATPLNPAFAESMTIVKDFWNVPVYGELLEVAERELNNFINEGEGTAEEAMNAIAKEHHQILLDAGLITE